MDGQFLRLLTHQLRYAAYRLGGAGPPLAPAAALLSSSCAGGLPGSAGGGLLRLLHTGLGWRSGSSAAEPATAARPAWLPPQLHLGPHRTLATSALDAALQAVAAGGGLPPGRGRRVAVGISGGVDSAVAALLLQRAGYDVVGVFMRNWDESEETGNQNCSVERDLRDAAAVCRQLSIPLHEADFVSDYWNQVFTEFLAQCERGLSPNPDLACNRHIKFDALLQFAGLLGAELVATGHYARLAPAAAGATAAPPGRAAAAGERAHPVLQLLRGVDLAKDQTYFLASVQPAALRHVLFPIGHLQKPDVRHVAAEAGLVPADKRSSAGICFIGRRNFADFLAQYIPPLPGCLVDVDCGAALGPCPDLTAVTHGQRPGIGGAPERVYAAGKDVIDRVVYVAQGRDHPALFCRTALLRTPHWLSPEHAARLAHDGSLRCQYKARYGQQPRGCTLLPVDAAAAGAVARAAAAAADALPLPAKNAAPAGASHTANDDAAAQAKGGTAAVAAAAGTADSSSTAAASVTGTAAAAAAVAAAAAALGWAPSAYCRLQSQDAAVLPSYVVALFDEPAAAITPQQAFVLYDGDRCLGAAPIAQPGRSLHEEQAAGSAAAAAGGRATLKLIKEMPFIGLFHHLRNQSKFEASGLALINGTYYVVFDSSESLGFLDDEFHFRSPKNRLVRDKGQIDSQFEGIGYMPESETFLLLKEAVAHGGHPHFHPHIVHARLTPDGDSWVELEQCKVDFEITSENKGFESIVYTHTSKGAYLMGLCEGNHCKGGKEGRDQGNGRIVLAQLGKTLTGECVWHTQRVLQIPPRADFTDYSAFAFAPGPASTKMAILSQTDAKVWIGDFDREDMAFTSGGQVFHFPRTNTCQTVYCNAEGVQWIDDRRIIVTSDKAKGYQPFWCDAKDQMVHIFSLPISFNPEAVVDPY